MLSQFKFTGFYRSYKPSQPSTQQGLQKQQLLLHPQSVAGRKASAYLTISDSLSQPPSIMLTPGRVSHRFQRQSQISRSETGHHTTHMVCSTSRPSLWINLEPTHCSAVPWRRLRSRSPMHLAQNGIRCWIKRIYESYHCGMNIVGGRGKASEMELAKLGSQSKPRGDDRTTTYRSFTRVRLGYCYIEYGGGRLLVVADG